MTQIRDLWRRIKNQKMRFSSAIGFLRETPRAGRIYGVVYVSHNIPDQLMAGSVYGAKITLENSGGFTWHRDDPKGSRIDLVLRLDGRVAGTYQMPRSMVKPGEQTTVCFPLDVPHQEGPHPVSLELVAQGTAWFSERGVSPLKMTLNSDFSKGSSFDDLREVSRSVNPWHYRPTGGIERSSNGKTFPLFASKARMSSMGPGGPSLY